jgi:tetratricopeptide (TPR) repeat protein
MNINIDFYQLMATLTKSERKYIIKNGSNSKTKTATYLKYFKKLIKKFTEGKIYSSAEILEIVKADKAPARQRNYLYNHLISCLNQYHTNTNKTAELYELLRTIHTLFVKRQLTNCDKLIRKAKKICLELENQTLMPEILWWEAVLYMITGEYVKNKNVFDVVLNDLKKINERIQYSFECHSLYFSFEVLYNQAGGWAINESEERLLNTFYARINEIDSIYSELDGTKADIILAKATFFMAKKEYESGIAEFEKIIELFENKRDKKNHETRKLVNAHNNSALCAILSGRDGVYDYLKEIQQKIELYSSTITAHNKYRYLSGTILHKLVYVSLNLGREGFYQELNLLEKEFLELRDKTTLDNNRILYSYYFFGLGYFIKRDYEKAIGYLNRVINDSKVKYQMIFTQANIVLSFIHFAKHNFDIGLKYIKYAAENIDDEKRKRNQLSSIIALVEEIIANAAEARQEKMLAAIGALKNNNMLQDKKSAMLCKNIGLSEWVKIAEATNVT